MAADYSQKNNSEQIVTENDMQGNVLDGKDGALTEQDESSHTWGCDAVKCFHRHEKLSFTSENRRQFLIIT